MVSVRVRSIANERCVTDNFLDMSDVGSFISAAKETVDAVLDELLPSAETEPKRLHEAMRWSTFAGGKRIRPALIFASGEAFGVDRERLKRTAAAIEMIHTFSLIHDDLPAMDDDDLRRGRPTCHVQFDEATAILAGDALLALAFAAIADDGSIDVATRLRLVSMIAIASATPVGMVAGQQLDLEAEGRESSIDAVEDIHSRKTGALIAASCLVGPTIAGADEGEIAAIRHFGTSIGLLFQIVDDLLDVTQGSETLGKTAGKDTAASKATYPGLIGLDAAREHADATLSQAIDQIAKLDRDTATLSAIAHYIGDRPS